MEIAEIINKRPVQYKIRVTPDEKELTQDGWRYYLISESDIVNPNTYVERPVNDKWVIEHMTEINQAFGKDMNNYLFLLYDSLEAVEEDFDEYAHNQKYCHHVLDKWVFWVG